MSSKGSPRQSKRTAGNTDAGKLRKKVKAMEADLGQARMAVLNMRQMYRQAEQELLQQRQLLDQREALIAGLIFEYGGDPGTVYINPETPEIVGELYQGFDFEEGPNDSLSLTLSARPGVVAAIEEAEDEDALS